MFELGQWLSGLEIQSHLHGLNRAFLLKFELKFTCAFRTPVDPKKLPRISRDHPISSEIANELLKILQMLRTLDRIIFSGTCSKTYVSLRNTVELDRARYN